jgi:hypothetical protein
MKKDRHSEFGCLMAVVDPEYHPLIIKIGKTAIPPEILYIDPDDPSYGYDSEPHVTIKYGFTSDLSRKDLAKMLRDIKPFDITVKKLGQFNNEKFDVIKFDIEKGDILSKLRKRADKFKNQDAHPDYHPHMTLAYVKPGTFPNIKDGLDIKLPITKFKYSGRDGKQMYINL